MLESNRYKGEIMLDYENKEYFEQYKKGLQEAIKNNNYKKYMRDNKYPNVYICERRVINSALFKHCTTHYLDIPIEMITGCNVSDCRKEIITDDNCKRVIDAIPYIVKGQCDPIEVIKKDEDYYIENGKHRYYAHILLGKERIPVSLVKEISDDKYYKNIESIKIVNAEFESERKYRNPNEALRFFRKYKEAFGQVLEVQMKGNEEALEYSLQIKNYRGEKIIFNNCCTSGNEWNGSHITYKILRECGFNIDKDYVYKNKSFSICDSRAVHNICFNNQIKDFKLFLNKLKEDIVSVESYKNYTDDMFKLHDYIWKNPENNTTAYHFSSISSFLCKGKEYTYYFIGTQFRDTDIDTVYIFKDKTHPFNNLTVQLIGKVTEGEVKYSTILEFLKDRCANKDELV
jgi:hypothetical protein